MARFYRHLRGGARARYWEEMARTLRRRTNALCFNGHYYTHRVPIVAADIPGLDQTTLGALYRFIQQGKRIPLILKEIAPVIILREIG